MGKREQPSQNTIVYRLKCVICDKVQDGGVSQKYRISERGRAENFLEAALLLKDDVYIRIADLDTIEKIFGADLYYHGKCLNKYLKK